MPTKARSESCRESVEALAFGAAVGAMETVAKAALLDEPVQVFDTDGNEKWVYPTISKQTLDAAKYILDFVFGKAATKPVSDASTEGTKELLRGVRELRKSRDAA